MGCACVICVGGASLGRGGLSGWPAAWGASRRVGKEASPVAGTERAQLTETRAVRAAHACLARFCELCAVSVPSSEYWEFLCLVNQCFVRVRDVK